MITTARMDYVRQFCPQNVDEMVSRGIDDCRKRLKYRKEAAARMIERGAPEQAIKWAQIRVDEAQEAVNKLKTKGGHK